MKTVRITEDQRARIVALFQGGTPMTILAEVWHVGEEKIEEMIRVKLNESEPPRLTRKRLAKFKNAAMEHAPDGPPRRRKTKPLPDGGAHVQPSL